MSENYWAYDCEVFSNWTYFRFHNDTAARQFRHTEFAELRKFITKDMVLIGYNNFGYDDLILRTILKNPAANYLDLYKISQQIVTSHRLPDNLFKLQYSDYPWKYSVDMFQILNKKGGLKEWEARCHMQSVRESPVDFNAPLKAEDYLRTMNYCITDTEATWTLFKQYQHLVDLRTKLREMYELGPRVYVLGDAGVAQAIFIDKYSKRTGGWSSTARKAAEQSDDNRKRKWECKELVSTRVNYQTEEFNRFFTFFKNCSLNGDSDGTRWEFNGGAFENEVQIGNNFYQIGVGGLHSIDKPGRFEATKDIGIFDLDVASYYPSLMIVENIYPKHIGHHFVQDFTAVRDMRLKAKRSGDKTTADALKIVANSTFGKFNDAYSPLRSIPSALRVTLNGQLQLLMLIERLEMAGVRVISANTDGVTFLWHRADFGVIDGIIKHWQQDTGHELELTEYSRYIRRDVNNYLALKTDGKVKTKGAFELAPLEGKTDNRIVKLAAQAYLLHGKPVHETVRASTDIKDFIFYQRVKNGGDLYWGSDCIGRTCRWYVGQVGKQVQRKNPDGTFANIPHGGNAKLTMEMLPVFPQDINYNYYIAEAKDLIESITHLPKPRKKKGAA